MSDGDPNQPPVPPVPPQEPYPSSPPPVPERGPTGPSSAAGQSFGEKFQSFANPPPLPFPAPASPDDRSWAVAIHISALFAHILGPLILWLIKRPVSAYLDAVGKETVNFQISFLIYETAALIVAPFTCGVLFFGLLVVWIILVIIATVKVSSGEEYRYPLTIRFLK